MHIHAKPHKLLVALLLVQRMLAQDVGSVLNGTWIATSGPQVWRGTWSAAISERTPDAAQGSWTLLNDSREVVLQGTWSAKRSGPHWHGTWRARATPGASLSGTWDADVTSPTAKNFADMLQLTIERQIGGWWRTVVHEGNWRLEAQPNKKTTRR
jgi:hypothetical protein